MRPLNFRQEIKWGKNNNSKNQFLPGTGGKITTGRESQTTFACFPNFLSSAAWKHAAPFIFHQTTLVLMLLLFSAVSGMMVVIALQQTREPACNPSADTLHTDDGFWTLLGQLFLQLLASFCTLYPVVVNHELRVPATRFWFMTLLAVSVFTALGAVVVYSWSWKIATMLSFGGAFAQIISAGQLAVSLSSYEKREGRRPLMEMDKYDEYDMMWM
ncbi:hypothetical protein GGI43DRAFT_214557 [Trichoderma evansii]